ncbi:MAG TPA: hypothetical protein PK307_02555 [Spirochaetota bacterium]|nr:hypothetical protein [Spirochaetota bacterium]HOD14472.1 hypothetical protein [Spirochaetota bacterium]HPG52482.1 hypothetical protein [Spirochaetota bacterium]HQL81058.1 hypothetical protein [Spirochaetota bacterium]
MKRAAIAIALLISLPAAAAHAAEETAEWKKGMAGAAFNGIAAGVQVEYRFIRPLAIRAIGSYIWGTGKTNGPLVGRGERLVSVILTPAAYIPTPVRFLEPVLFFGPSFSHFRWKSPWFKINGIINDFTFGGGGGLGFIVAPFCRIGINCWINYDYKMKQEYGVTKKGKRIALVMPFLDACFLF